MWLKTAKKKTHKSYSVDEQPQPIADDDEGEVVPGTTTNEQQLERRNLIDLLKNMDVTHLKMQHGYCTFLEGLDQQMLKACLQDLVDYTTRTVTPGQRTTRILKVPGVRMEHTTGLWLLYLLRSVFSVTALDIEILPQQVYVYDRQIDILRLLRRQYTC